MNIKTVYAVGIVKKEVTTNIGFKLDLVLGEGGCGALPVFKDEETARAYAGKSGAAIFPISVGTRNKK